MTRNIRRKAAAPPAKTKRRRGSDNSSTPDLSSDGGYSALDEVSDSEDDDEDGVYAAEEKHIIKDVTKIRHGPSPRPVAQKEEEDADEEEGDGDGDGGSDDEDEDDLDDLDDADFADFIAQEDGNKDNDGGAEDSANAKFADDGASWNGISESDANHNGAVVGVQASPPKRQVRFAGVPDSDSDSTTSEVSVHDSQYFPDIFVEQNLLDPGFRREIEHESDSSVSSSFWDYSYGYGLEPDASAVQLSDADLFAAGLPDPVDVLLPPVVEKEEVVEDDELDGYESEFARMNHVPDACGSRCNFLLMPFLLLLTHPSQPTVTPLRMTSRSRSRFGESMLAASSLLTATVTPATRTRKLTCLLTTGADSRVRDGMS